jgi:hypothetical protein
MRLPARKIRHNAQGRFGMGGPRCHSTAPSLLVEQLLDPTQRAAQDLRIGACLHTANAASSSAATGPL